MYAVEYYCPLYARCESCQHTIYLLIKYANNYRQNIHSLLKINLHEKQAYTFVKFSDKAKNLPFVTLISVAPPLNPKTFDIRRIILKCSKRL